MSEPGFEMNGGRQLELPYFSSDDGNIDPAAFGPPEIPEPEYSDPYEEDDWGDDDEEEYCD
jgi:hypothetical protein